ncbi:hypothetical protein, partial [Pseudomonas alabamensis]|uniref:hypothetical protein n=1 Tax=Pseudomonas alabamensis TaxID=3064349 RepID=UPI003F64A6B2
GAGPAAMGRKAALKSISNEAPDPASYRHVLCATARQRLAHIRLLALSKASSAFSIHLPASWQ